MKWYIHPSRHLDGDELPPELVLTNGDGSVSQVYVPYNESDASAVLQAVDQLRRELSGYHGQLKAHNDLQRHCDNQRERITELEGLYAEAKAENAKLHELVRDMFACINHANEQDWFYFERDKSGCGMDCVVNGEGCGLPALVDRMRELGVVE